MIGMSQPNQKLRHCSIITVKAANKSTFIHPILPNLSRCVTTPPTNVPRVAPTNCSAPMSYKNADQMTQRRRQSAEKVMHVNRRLLDQAMILFNCVLQRHGQNAEKLRTSKGDYLIKQCSLQLRPFSNGNFS